MLKKTSDLKADCTHKYKSYKSFVAREEVLEKSVQRVCRQRKNAIKDIQQQQLNLLNYYDKIVA